MLFRLKSTPQTATLRMRSNSDQKVNKFGFEKGWKMKETWPDDIMKGQKIHKELVAYSI